jgi:hypothetical protein
MIAATATPYEQRWAVRRIAHGMPEQFRMKKASVTLTEFPVLGLEGLFQLIVREPPNRCATGVRGQWWNASETLWWRNSFERDQLSQYAELRHKLFGHRPIGCSWPACYSPARIARHGTGFATLLYRTPNRSVNGSYIEFERLPLHSFRRSHSENIADHIGEAHGHRQTIVEVARIVIDFGQPHDVLQNIVQLG